MGQTPASTLRRQGESGPHTGGISLSHRVILAAAVSLRVQPAQHPRAGADFLSAACHKPWSPIFSKPLICPALSTSQVTPRREGDGCGERSSRKDETLCTTLRCLEIRGSRRLPAARRAPPGRCTARPAGGRIAPDSRVSLLSCPTRPSPHPPPPPPAPHRAQPHRVPPPPPTGNPSRLWQVSACVPECVFPRTAA